MGVIASVEYLETMLSHRQKQIFMKFEILQYSETTKDFTVMDTLVVEQRHLPNGIDALGGTITANTDQDSRWTLDVQIANHDSVNNWSDNFDPDEIEDFDWWLDKRLNVYIGLLLDDSRIVEYDRIGHFVVTHFKTNHELMEFPVIEIQGASKEIMFSSRKGKFLYDTTIRANTVMTEAIKTLLIGGGELASNIRIDPSIGDKSVNLEDGTEANLWDVFFSDASIHEDTLDFATGTSSVRIDVNKHELGILAKKTFAIPLDLTGTQGLAFFGRCSKDVEIGDISLVINNQDGKTNEYPFLELVGHAIGDNDEIYYTNNWRNVVLSTAEFSDLNNVVSIELKINSKIDDTYSLWIDSIHVSEIRNLLPYELVYGAGDNRWNAVKEIAHLLDATPYYDEYGNFILKKNKFPKERYSGKFNYDIYEVLETKMVYNDRKRYNNLYAGTQDEFNEHDLANHIQVTGGSTYETVMSLVDLQVRLDGIVMREKGKYINRRGQVRAVDQFYEGAEPTIFNKDTNVEEVYKYHKNKDQAIEDYPNGFPETTEPPIINYAIEKIGDYIYHHNNADPDPVITYAYEGKNRALWEIRQRLAHAEQLTILSAPYYTLRLNDIIRVEDSLLEIDDNFEIRGLSIPLNGDYMNLNVVKVKNQIIDIPYFDNTHPKANASWYNYDTFGLAFTYVYWKTRESQIDKDGNIKINVTHTGNGRGITEIKQNGVIKGKGSDKISGDKLLKGKYTAKVSPNTPIEIVAKTNTVYKLMSIKDGNGRNLSSVLQPNNFYPDMDIYIDFVKK